MTDYDHIEGSKGNNNYVMKPYLFYFFNNNNCIKYTKRQYYAQNYQNTIFISNNSIVNICT